MKLGEVCIMTDDVVREADFLKKLLNVENGSDDAVHQFIISEETTLTVFCDGKKRGENKQNICLAFTVDDIDAEYKRICGLGITVCDPPTVRPWGAKNMSMLDPDGNVITFRQFLKQEQSGAKASDSKEILK